MNWSPKKRFITQRGVRERVARLFLMHANKREKIKSVSAGSIALAVGLKEAEQAIH